MAYQTLNFEQETTIAILTLNQRDKRNARCLDQPCKNSFARQ